MDLEVREIPVQSRAMYNSRLKSYKQEMEKLEKDFVSTSTLYSYLIDTQILSAESTQVSHLSLLTSEDL